MFHKAIFSYLLHVQIKSHLKRSDIMRGSRNFRQGGGPGQSDKKALTTFFFVFFSVRSLFYRSQMVNFKEIYHFSRFQRGSNIFQGGGGPIAYSP